VADEPDKNAVADDFGTQGEFSENTWEYERIIGFQVIECGGTVICGWISLTWHYR
jgi:hypothetical protein